MEPGETKVKWGPASVEETLERIGPLMVLPEGSVGIELGVEWGVHADLILQVVKPKHLTLVDWWRNLDAYEIALSRFKHLPHVTMRRKKTLDVVAEFDDESFDWAFIDANHGEEAVYSDIRAYYSKVRQGGWILCHDYWIDVTAKGIDAAVRDEPGLRWVGVGNDRLKTVILRKRTVEVHVE